MRGVFGLLLLGGGAALAVAVGAGWNPLQALQAWANSGTNPIVPHASDSATPIARTSGGKSS